MPLIVAGLGWVLGREKVPPLGQLGLALGFAGVALVMGTRVTGGADPIGIALCVAGATGLAVATLTVRSVSAGGNLLMVVGLQMWVGSALLAGVIGTLIGLLAAYAGGRVDAALMRLVDLLLSFPTILMALMILAWLGKGVGNVVLTLVQDGDHRLSSDADIALLLGLLEGFGVRSGA